MTPAFARLSLRGRLMLIGVFGVATALAVGSVALYGVLTVLSYRTLDANARATAGDVATLVLDGRLPDVIPVTGSQIVQVVDARDRVVSASVNSDRLTALLRPDELVGALRGQPVVVRGSRVGLALPLRVLAVRAGPRAAPVNVLVAQQFDDIEHSQRILGLTLVASYPVLLLVLALMAWRVMGATLRPVESMRVTAERISGAGHDERLPVPTSSDEIQRLAVTLNAMLDRLAASRARQRSFVADAAHELRSPLASMQTQIDVAEHLGEDLPPAADLRAEVSRMTRLVEDLLALARLDSEASATVDVGPVGLESLLEGVAERYARANISVTTRSSTLVLRARADDVRRALANLTDNAVRHARSEVEVTAYVEADHVVVADDDDGPGIPADDRGRVFERFARLDEGRDRDAGGAGLGLAIVAELMSRNGGSARLGEAPGGGLRAELVLPRWSGAVVSPDPPQVR
ncbi:MAG: HAMP domain-containing sensor histidine kinase [Marmoricola sp.]